ncbi:MAG: BTAD domain-containing putative transcriptional regulator, partial [Anaerolineae bacterium]
MSILRISLFGDVRIARDDWSSEVRVTRSVQALLAYLLLQRHRVHPREVLAGLFWGDHSENRARSCLSTALWRLRSALEPEGIPRGTYLVRTPAGEIGFNHESDHWLDVAVFEEQAGRVLAQPIDVTESAKVQELENALRLYTGELLEGFYDDWALRERERLRFLYLNSLAHLMHYHKYQGAYEESLAYGQQILQHDPLREEIHREMMRLY